MQTQKFSLAVSSAGVKITGGLPARVVVPLNEALIQEISVAGVTAQELNVQSIYCAFAADFLAGTPPALLVTSGITLTAGESGGVLFSVPLPGATAELRALIGNAAARPIYEEIGGYDTDGAKLFSFRFPVTVTAEIYPGSGLPPVYGDPAYLNAAQIEAAMARQLIYEYSADGDSWHNGLMSGDLYFRVKNGAPGLYSEPQSIPYGPVGAVGATRYPVTACFGNETYQIVCYLDAAHCMTFAGYIAEPVNKIDLYIVSANPEYTGNIVLNVDAESFTVPVGATVGKVTLNLTVPATGIVSIVRDTANAGDTLSDGTDAITAFVVDWSVQ